jgi:hypothetical protein
MNYKKGFFLLIIFSVMFSCSQDEISEDVMVSKADLLIEQATNSRVVEGIREVTHNYNYYGEEFSVIYSFDDEINEVVNISGDLEMAETIFGTEETSPQGVLYEDIQEDSATINIRLFNKAEELDIYAALNIDYSDEIHDVFNNFCIDYSERKGLGSMFYFFKHKNFDTEMTGMRGNLVSFYQDAAVGPSYNDQLSSLIAFKNPGHDYIAVELYEHNCFFGRKHRFEKYFGSIFVSNLKDYYLYKFLIWKRGNWNDYVSSTRGGSIDL